MESFNYHKVEHFARVSRSKTENTRIQRVNYLEAAHSEEESEPEEIQQITQINKILPEKNDNYGIKLKINGKLTKSTKTLPSILDLRSQSCQTTRNYTTQDIHPLKERYQDVNKNEIKFLGKVWANIEYNGETTKLPILITQTKDNTPLLGVNWLKQLPITINKSSLDEHTNQSNNIHTKFHKLFETNHTVKKAEVKIQIKPGCYPLQQKAKPIPYHLQKDVKKKRTRPINKTRTP